MNHSAIAWAVVLGAASAGTAASAGAQEPVRVVASLPVYGSIAEAIGGDQVRVTSIADPREDAHFVRPKPSFAAELRRADLFITIGLDLELWVPPLLDRAGNARVAEGQRGYVTTYTGIRLLDVPASADRSGGDIHVFGNPHVYTDPLNAVIVARNITTGLKRVAPERAAAWDAGLARFTDEIHRRLFGTALVDIVGGDQLGQLARAGRLPAFLRETKYEGSPLEAKLGGWLGTAAEFAGENIVCYHKNWAYFEDRFGVTCLEYVESKPGIPPTPGHVARLIDLMRQQRVHVLIAAEYFGRDKPATVAERAGATVVMMPLQTGSGSVRTYFDLVDAWVDGLAHALRARR